MMNDFIKQCVAKRQAVVNRENAVIKARNDQYFLEVADKIASIKAANVLPEALFEYLDVKGSDLNNDDLIILHFELLGIDCVVVDVYKHEFDQGWKVRSIWAGDEEECQSFSDIEEAVGYGYEYAQKRSEWIKEQEDKAENAAKTVSYTINELLFDAAQALHHHDYQASLAASFLAIAKNLHENGLCVENL